MSGTASLARLPLLLLLLTWSPSVVSEPARPGPALEALLTATARGAGPLAALLRRADGPRGRQALSARDPNGWSALAVAAYNGDAEAAKSLIDVGARVDAGEISAFLRGNDEAGAPIGSLVELVVRRASMLIMLGTGFLPPPYLRGAMKKLATSRAPSPEDGEVPDMARTLQLLVGRGGARPTEKAVEEGSDVSRAAYFLDSGLVEALVQLQVEESNGDIGDDAIGIMGLSRALVATIIGISQMKHRLNRALLQMPVMAGRMFRDYYGFETGSEEALTSPTFLGMSFEDTMRIVQDKAMRIVQSLLAGRADPNYQQSRQSRKAALHQCADHGLTSLAEALLEARANPNAPSFPLEHAPLHSAVVHRSAGVLRALLAARADPEQRDVAGRSAKDVARMVRWAGGQAMLDGKGAGVRADLLPRHGQVETIVVPELLPAGWRAKWERGDMGPEWAERAGGNCELDIVDAADIDTERFVSEYISLRRPLLVRGGSLHMPAAERWKSLRYLTRKAGGTTMSAVTIPYPEDFGDHDAKDSRKVTLEHYVEHIMGKVNSTSGTPLYVFSVVEQNDPNFKKLLNLIQHDATPNPHWLIQDDTTKLRLRFGNIQFGLGPAGSGAPQHYHTHAYASLFTGRKKWWFYPPPRSSLSRHHSIRAAEADAATRRQLKPAPLGQEALARETLPLVCEQGPGDVVYVPTDWGHMTLNTETALSLSREFTWDGEETDSHVINSLQL